MKTIELTDKQIIVLKSLLLQEIDYLENEAIPEAIGHDKRSLKTELSACIDLMKQLNN